MKYKDGHDLGDGLVVSAKYGFVSAVYRCACDREQMAKHEEFVGGLSAETAELIGWEKYDGKWVCPFCSENEGKLKGAFDSSRATLQ